VPEVVDMMGIPQIDPGPAEDFFPLHRTEFAAKIPVCAAPSERGGRMAPLERAGNGLCRRPRKRALRLRCSTPLAAVVRGAPYPKWDFDELWRNYPPLR